MNVAEELESFGVAGPSKIRQVLSKTRKTSTFIAAVKKFQEDNAIKIESLVPAANLLDLHGIKRKDFHEQAVSDLTERLLHRIRILGEDSHGDQSNYAIRKLEDHLDQCFRLYQLPQFRPIILETLKQLPSVPESYLQRIIDDFALYSECDIKVRQQIWLQHESLFLSALQPVIDGYLSRKRDIEFAIEQSNTNFFTFETTKARRQWKEVQDIVAMVGNHEKLYYATIKLIRDRYLESADYHLCSLRSEIVMAAHDLNLDEIVKTDPCHDLVWCLDSCVRDKQLDQQQTVKLKGILDGCKRSTAEVIQDMAMIACDVHVTHFLLSMVVKKMRDATGAHLPRDLQSLQLAMRVIAFGCNAHEIVSSVDNLSTTVVDSILFTKFLPVLETCMVEDNMRMELIRAKIHSCDGISINSCLTELPDIIITFIKANSVAALVYLHYVLDLLPSKRRVDDLSGLNRYILGLTILRGQLTSKGVWSHLFIHRLIYSNQFESALSDPLFQETIMDHILLKHLQSDEVVKYQLLRIINQIGFIWGVPLCQEMLAKMKPENLPELSDAQSARYRVDYERVVDKLTPRAPEELQQQRPGQLHLITSPTKVGGMSGMGSPPPVRQYPAIIGTPRISY